MAERYTKRPRQLKRKLSLPGELRSIRFLRETAKRIWKVNPWFVAVIVFPNADVDIERPVKQAHVMNSRELVRFIRETG